MAQLATINPLNQFFALNGSPLNNGKLYFGTINEDPEQNPVQMYWDAAGLVPALQPIRTTSGYPSRSGSPAILYCAVEYSLRVRQSNDVQVFYVPRAGSIGLQEFGQWAPTTVTPSFVSTTSFTVNGDQTADFQPSRRARFTVTAGIVYGTILTAVYGALTTVTMVMDGASVLDAGLESVDLSILTPLNPSVPTTYAKSGANIDIASRGNNTSTIYTTAGTSTAYTLTPVPAITAYAAGQSFFVNFNAASGAAPTITINGVGTPPNLVKQLADGTYANLAADDITADHRSRVTLISATQALVERTAKRQYELVFQSSTSYGSDASNKIKRYANTLVNQGGDAMTATDSATAGLSVTINIAGKYSVGIDATGATTNIAGVSVNSSQLTTGIFTITAADRICCGTGVASNNSTTSRTRYFAAGDVIRPHADGTAAQTSAVEQFSIIKVD